VRTEVLCEWAAIEGLRPEWNALLRASRADTVFLTWEWVAAWREAAGRFASPFVVAVRDAAGALVGLAPLYRAGFRLFGLLPYRGLRVLGDQDSGAEYGDFLAAASVEDEVARALAAGLAGSADAWDLLWMPNVPGWTGAYPRVAESGVAAGLAVRSRQRDFSAAHLPEDPPAFMKALSGNARSALGRQSRHVFEGSAVVFEQCRAGATLPAFLHALFELNHRRWTAVGQSGTFVRKPLERRFYEAFAPRALERGWLRLFALRSGDRFLAVQLGYAYRGTFFQLQEGFDPGAARGVGNVLRWKVIECCIEEGLRVYDFLGEHTEHKRRWLAERRVGYDLLLRRRTPMTVAAAMFWPSGRYLRPTAIPVGPRT